MKTFIDRCTPYCNHNMGTVPVSTKAKGSVIAVRAGQSKQENLNLVCTSEHFLGHLEIPLAASFTTEGVDTQEDLFRQPQILSDAYAFDETFACIIKCS